MALSTKINLISRNLSESNVTSVLHSQQEGCSRRFHINSCGTSGLKFISLSPQTAQNVVQRTAPCRTERLRCNSSLLPIKVDYTRDARSGTQKFFSQKRGQAARRLRILSVTKSELETELDQNEIEGSAGLLGGKGLVGEDAAAFNAANEKTSSWIKFTLVLGVVLGILYYIWLDPDTGYGGAFIEAISSLSDNHEVVMVVILFVFALVHSGGAALRAQAEALIGERAYRVLYAGLSLPLAVSAVAYFINHRYDGVQLWQLRTVPGVHELVWVLSFVSFFFLYPSTFNLLEVAAVDKPQVHLWETGVMRITRHPQMVGQLIWCFAHTLWIGNSFTLTTSIALLAHHAFGVWHGDKRLAAKYGKAFEDVKSRTSIVPGVAIIEGRQKLPQDFYKEFLRVPYFAIVGVTVGAYFSHPLMQIASYWLHW